MAAPQLTSKVEISISCRNLPDRDLLSKSDPICVLFMGTGKSMREMGRTECLANTLDPDFNHKFQVDFCFEERQQVAFRIYDVDSARAVLSDHDFLGELETSIGELVSRRRYEAALVRTGCAKRSLIVLTCLELQECKQMVNLLVEGRKLDKKDFFGKSDPYLEIYQPMEDVTAEADVARVRSWLLVHRTEVIKQNLNPRWAPFSIPINRLCRGNKQLLLRFDCHDYDNDGSHDFIGSFYSNIESLEQEVARSRSAQKTLMSKKRKSAGTIVFSQVTFEAVDSFVDYIQGGCELHFTVAIDFTGSNGDPRDPRSLHHVSADGRPNQYELAIISVGEVVQDYDSDRQFPALGFGALLPPRFSGVQDAFALTLQPNNPYCAGMQGLLAAYRSCIRSVKLYGPTNFSPVINHVASMARAHQTGAQYFVLLIITDGIITDFQQTKEAIIKASSLPMSIIIVGVGNEDFSAMEELDSDDKRLRCGSLVAERDVVQFVALRQFIQDGNLDRSRYALAKEVLAELPNQVCEWMKRHGIRAGPPRARQDAPLDVGGVPGAPVSASYAAGPQSAPGYPGGSQSAPSYPGGQHSAPGYPGGAPGYPVGAPGYPAGYPGSQGYPAGALGYPGAPGYPSGAPGYSGAPPSAPGYPGAPPSAPGYPGAPPSAPGYPGATPSAPGYPGASPSAPGYPSAPPSVPGYPAGPQTAPGYPAGPQTAPGYPAGPQTVPGYPAGPQTAPGYPAGPQTAPGYPGVPQRGGPGYAGTHPSYPTGPQGQASPSGGPPGYASAAQSPGRNQPSQSQPSGVQPSAPP